MEQVRTPKRGSYKPFNFYTPPRQYSASVSVPAKTLKVCKYTAAYGNYPMNLRDFPPACTVAAWLERACAGLEGGGARTDINESTDSSIHYSVHLIYSISSDAICWSHVHDR